MRVCKTLCIITHSQLYTKHKLPSAHISLLCAGEIPTSLFTLPALQYLDLSWNQLSGPIPEFKGVSSRLQMNELTEQIPQSLLVLPNLIHLDIEGNNLMGTVDIASLLWRLENLT